MKTGWLICFTIVSFLVMLTSCNQALYSDILSSGNYANQELADRNWKVWGTVFLIAVLMWITAIALLFKWMLRRTK